MATSFFINFESDSIGNKNNDFISNSSPLVKFSDSLNQDLSVSNFQPQSNGLGLGVDSDDTSKLIIEPTDNTDQFESLSLVFGNDDSSFLSSVYGYNDPLYAVLEIYKDGVQVGKTTEVANGNDLADQEISAPANAEFDQVNFYYAWDIGNGIEAAPLIEVVDDITGILASVVGSITLDGTPNDDNLTGTPGNDTINAFNSQDALQGLAGDDILDGGDGDDKLFGGEGNDTLLGGNGQDQLLGDAGNDFLNGGTGDNTLTGGGGKDTFVLSTSGKNNIVDFQDGQDLLKLDGGLTFGSLSIFNQNGDTWITTNNNQPLAFLAGVDANLITTADFTV